MLAKTWKWLLTGAAVVIAMAIAYFAGGSRPRQEQQAAVDAARSDDLVKSAEEQAKAAREKANILAIKAVNVSSTIQKQRKELESGHVDTSEIDQLLRSSGILK